MYMLTSTWQDLLLYLGSCQHRIDYIQSCISISEQFSLFQFYMLLDLNQKVSLTEKKPHAPRNILSPVGTTRCSHPGTHSVKHQGSSFEQDKSKSTTELSNFILFM